MDEQKLHILKTTGHYLSVPKGISMWPMLKSRENVVDIVLPNGRLKKYDVALYYRASDNSCVLHRVLQVRDKDYVIYGDNCWQTEIVTDEQIIGVADKFYRNGKWIPVSNKGYLAYVHLWCDFLPARRLIIRIRDKIKREIKKINIKKQG